MSAAKPLTVIPTGFGSGGAGLSPNGGGSSTVAGSKPTLEQLLNEHRAAILALQGGGAGKSGPVIEARFATTANITLASTALTALDGVTPVAGDPVLVKNQTAAAENGLYVASAGAWTRLKDDAGNDVIETGMLVTVSEGTANKDKTFFLTTDAPITVGTTGLAFSATTAGIAKGANLTDADATVTVLQGNWRVLPAATLSAGRSITLGTTGAVAGDRIQFTRLDVSANTLAFINGGVGAGTLFTMAVSKLGCAEFQFDGTNWALKTFGVQ